MTHKLYSTKEAAAYLGVSESFLQHDRMKDTPKIRFIKMGYKLVRYRKSVLDEYLRKLEESD